MPAEALRARRGADRDVVAELVAGLRPTANTAERRAAVAELSGRGWTATRIGSYLGMTTRLVERDRAVNRAERQG